MAHGSPDWWGAQPKEQNYPVSDMAELSVRLGSPNKYQRSGEVILLEDWSYGKQEWHEVGVDTVHATYLTTKYAASKGFCVLLQPEPTNGSVVTLEKWLYVPRLGRVGYGITFAPVTNLNYLWWGIDEGYSGTKCYWEARFKVSTGVVQVRDSNSVWQTVGSPGVQIGVYPNFVSAKVVFDTLNNNYLNFWFGRHKYDASAYGPVCVPTSENDYIRVYFSAVVSGANTILAPVDTIVITQNEP